MSLKSLFAGIFTGLFFLSVVLSSADANDTARLRAIFQQTGDRFVVTIPPGDYFLDGANPIDLRSDTTIIANGARFHFPKALEDKSRIVLFHGENICNFHWQGGHFEGHVFDPSKTENAWPPNANTRAILISTTANGITQNITFRDISSHGLAGAAITVLGSAKTGSERDIENFAQNVTVQNCTFERSGKFMWDYGYLWQIMIWPEEFSPFERSVANRYFKSRQMMIESTLTTPRSCLSRSDVLALRPTVATIRFVFLVLDCQKILRKGDSILSLIVNHNTFVFRIRSRVRPFSFLKIPAMIAD